MSGYPKIWTKILDEDWFIEWPLSARGIFLQLILEAKRQGDTGTVCYRSWTALGLRLGADRTVIGRWLLRFQQQGRVNIVEKSTTLLKIEVCNYKHYQGLKNLNPTTPKPQPVEKSTEPDPTNPTNPTNPTESSCRANKFDDEDMAVAQFLESEIRKNLPDFKQPNLNSWANDVRRMRQIDNRTIDGIRRVIAFATTDPFWKSNILSMSKLRKQFDQLSMKMKGNNHAVGTDRQDIDEYDIKGTVHECD